MCEFEMSGYYQRALDRYKASTPERQNQKRAWLDQKFPDFENLGNNFWTSEDGTASGTEFQMVFSDTNDVERQAFCDALRAYFGPLKDWKRFSLLD